MAFFMNKKLVKAIIPLCIFILFISFFIQNHNDKYKNEEVIETMAKNEEKDNEENDNAKKLIKDKKSKK